MTYETYNDTRSRSYVHRPFAFLFSCWCRRTTAWWWRPRRAARACAGGGTGNVRERGYHVLLSYSLLNTRTPTRHDTAHSHAHALALKRDTAKQAGGLSLCCWRRPAQALPSQRCRLRSSENLTCFENETETAARINMYKKRVWILGWGPSLDKRVNVFIPSQKRALSWQTK